mmetsp:Transcript_31774/g.69460  ORF Transcript_31774/g.69460 Transcript_31774/m.69460 type:complete len:343 (+) Transcript_31774:170-1198(+)
MPEGDEEEVEVLSRGIAPPGTENGRGAGTRQRQHLAAEMQPQPPMLLQARTPPTARHPEAAGRAALPSVLPSSPMAALPAGAVLLKSQRRHARCWLQQPSPVQVLRLLRSTSPPAPEEDQRIAMHAAKREDRLHSTSVSGRSCLPPQPFPPRAESMLPLLQPPHLMPCWKLSLRDLVHPPDPAHRSWSLRDRQWPPQWGWRSSRLKLTSKKPRYALQRPQTATSLPALQLLRLCQRFELHLQVCRRSYAHFVSLLVDLVLSALLRRGNRPISSGWPCWRASLWRASVRRWRRRYLRHPSHPPERPRRRLPSSARVAQKMLATDTPARPGHPRMPRCRVRPQL